MVVHNDDDYEASLQSLLVAGGWQGEDVWVFAYGSLLWNPAFEVAEQVLECYRAGIARFAFSSRDSAERRNSRD